LLIDGGIIPSQSESTIVEIVGDDIKILREGNVPEKEIRELN
jgi:tRNA A37 threonylcarbamoyladenosine synthetase subunit TsaC/SUA5/YrdC